MAEQKTPAQLAEARRRDVMAFAYKDKDGKYYTVDAGGNRVEATLGATLADGTKVQALSPEFQKVADQAAAIVMLYSKVLALEPAQRSLLGQMAKGHTQAAQGVTAATMAVWEELKKTTGVEMPGAGTLGAIGGGIADVASGFTLPATFLSELFGAGKDIASQFGGQSISRENAMAIGIAYASARQVAASGRTLDPSLGDYFGGLFSKNFGSYLGAGLAWLLDKVVGLLEHIPGIGPWIKKQGWGKDLSLGEHIERHSREDDNLRVEQEMTKLAKIGGRDSKEVAGLLNRKAATVRLPSGEEATVRGADKNNIAPSMDLPSGAPAPQTVDAAAELRKLTELSFGKRLAGAADRSDFGKTKEKIDNADPLLLGAGALGGVGAAVQVVRGALEGDARSEIKNSFKAADKAEAAHDKAKAKAEKLEAKVNNATQSGNKTAKEIAKMEAELAEAKKLEAAAKLKAEKAFENSMNRSANKSRFAEAGLQKMDTWEHLNPVKRVFVDSWRGVGRLIGDGLNKLDHLHVMRPGKELELLQKHLFNPVQMVKNMVSETKGVLNFINSGKPVEAVADAAKATSTVGEVAKAGWVATKATVIAKVAPVLKGMGRVPVVGAAATVGTLALVPAANAEVVNGEKLNMREQLITDYVTGRISPEKYNTYRKLQDNYMLTGVGGLLTTGITELVQNGLGELDKASMLRYLPESLVDMVRNPQIPASATSQAQVLSTAEREARLAQVQAKSPLDYLKMLTPLSIQGVMDRTVDWNQVNEAVKQVPLSAPVAPAQKTVVAPLTNEQLAAAHAGVIEQARSVTKVTTKPILNLNLGTGFAKVSKTDIGGFAMQTPGGATTGAEQASAMIPAAML